MRKKILIMASYPIYPPDNAGAKRIFNFSKELSKYYEVVHFSQCVNKHKIINVLQGKPSYSDIVIGKNYKIIQSYDFLYNFFLFLTSRINSQNFLADKLLNIHLDKKLKKEIKGASLIQVEHPWQFPWANKIGKKYKIPVILSVHNVETDIIKQTIANIPFKKNLIGYLRNREQQIYNAAENIIYLSENEKIRFNHLGIDKNEYIIPMWPDDELFRIKRPLRESKKTNILFVGSNWKPNLQALEFIEKLAVKNIHNKNMLFTVAGSVGENRQNTINLKYSGRVKAIIPYFKAADIFINPVTTGSGVNYKVIEAMAASLPVITTPFGSRGIKLDNNQNAIITGLSGFNKAILELIDNKRNRIKIGDNARNTAFRDYSRKKVIKRMLKYYKKILN